jgi:hypothetical protein
MRGGVALLTSVGVPILISKLRNSRYWFGGTDDTPHITEAEQLYLARMEQTTAASQAPMNMAARFSAVQQWFSAQRGARAVGVHIGLVLGGVVIFSAAVGAMRVMSWISPPRDDFKDISENMSFQAVLAFSPAGRSLDMPPAARTSLRERFIWSARVSDWLSHALLGPCFEEISLGFAAAVIAWPVVKVGSLMLPVLASPVAGRAFYMATHVALSGWWHQKHKRTSAILLTCTGQLLSVVALSSPFSTLPLFHVLVNHLTTDAYAHISPLSGLQLDQDCRLLDTPEARQARSDLKEELEFFFAPEQHRSRLRLTVALRSIPLLRLLIPARRHPMFMQPSPREAARWFLPFGQPSPQQLSPHYCCVIYNIFQCLDSNGNGFLNEKALAFLLLLRPDYLELMRGAFVTLDIAETQSELTQRSGELREKFESEEAAAQKLAAEHPSPSSAAAQRRQQANIKRQHELQQSLEHLERTVVPLETYLVHIARRLPGEDEHMPFNAPVSPQVVLPYPCAQWCSPCLLLLPLLHQCHCPSRPNASQRINISWISSRPVELKWIHPVALRQARHTSDGSCIGGKRSCSGMECTSKESLRLHFHRMHVLGAGSC